MVYNWKKLQNGSDIRGVALEGVKGENVNLTAEVAETLGKAFVSWLAKKGYSDIIIAVGMDSRISGNKLKKAFSLGVSGMGANIIDCGLASTPAMFMTCVSDKISVQGSVILTASHLPFNRNGMKFFTKEGGLNKQDISDILELASINRFAPSKEEGSIESFDFISEYSDILVSGIRENVKHSEHYDEPLKGTKIIVDAGNGAGGFFANKVLQALGADIEGSQYLNPDGRFPNHIPNPEDKVAMDSICKAVLDHQADLGIIFDTDVDRSAIVDRQGKPINRNALIALISAVILEEHPGSTIVTDSITSEGLGVFIEKDLKGKHHRFKRGYKNVINESVRLNDAGQESWLAIETSGHAALKENYFLDDGAFLIAKLLVKMAQLGLEGKELGELIENLKHPVESREFRLKIGIDDFLDFGNNVIEELEDAVKGIAGWEMETENFEGIRVNCSNEDEQGWFLLRMSLHDPVMPLNIESNIEGGIEVIKAKLKTELDRFAFLDTAVM